MKDRVGRLWRTARHLRRSQFTNRITRRLPRPGLDVGGAPPPRRSPAGPWHLPARREPSLLSEDRIRLLNVAARLAPGGEWNDPAHDKLWLYNLHYFDDLLAREAAARASWHASLIARWIAQNPPGAGNGWEPYPLSIRISNWVRWLSGGAEADERVLQSLATQVRWLVPRVEWHLLGNHLFSNAKALTLAGLFFEGAEAESWLAQGLRILRSELPEQVLPDGGNFERSPMYHALMTEDLLDLVNAAGLHPGLVPADQLGEWREAGERMLRWLVGMSHPDGRFALFNDAAFGVASANAEIIRYAAELGLAAEGEGKTGLRHWPDSGYARWERGDAVAFLDLAPVGPDYLPGHAHADTLSFELSVRGQRIVVNGGTSRYGNDAVRAFERSTAAHSTVEVAGLSSSEVWHGFRVGRRARPFEIAMSGEGGAFRASAAHDGYAWLPGRPIHRRRWEMTDDGLTVTDTVSDATYPATARYILAPDVEVDARDASRVVLTRSGAERVVLQVREGEAAIEPAWYGPEFGKRLETSAVAVRLADGRAQAQISWT